MKRPRLQRLALFAVLTGLATGLGVYWTTRRAGRAAADGLAQKPTVAIGAPATSDRPAGRDAGAEQKLRAQVRANPAAALATARTLGLDVPGRAELERALRKWIREDPRAALRRVTALPESHDKLELLGFVLGELALRDPEAAVSEVQRVAAAETRERLVLEIMRALAGSDDPGMAAVYSGAIGDGPRAEEAVKIAVDALVAGGAASEAVTWAGSLEAQTKRQAALRELAAHFVHSDPELAVRIAELLPEGGARADLLRRARVELEARETR